MDAYGLAMWYIFSLDKYSTIDVPSSITTFIKDNFKRQLSTCSEDDAK
jgi:hypothetical protein